MTPSGEEANPASSIAEAIVSQLLAEGMRDVVVCPGSRSQALALALADRERRGDLTLHVRIDERSAGFLALGLARASGLPVAVVTTSGSAVANLWPAVIEAHHDAVPLVVVTADRPPELHGVAANQTTQQAGIFGFAAPTSSIAPAWTHELESAIRTAQETVSAVLADAGDADGPGPVHLNVAFRDPLSGAAHHLAAKATAAPRRSSAAAEPAALTADDRTVVIAGAGAGHAAADFAHDARLPLIAEITSDSRLQNESIVHYRALLRGPLGERVRRAIVFGRPTLSRDVAALLARDDVEVIVVDRAGAPEQVHPEPTAKHFAAIAVGTSAPLDWLDAWRSAEAGLEPTSDPARDLVHAVWRASATGDAVYFASSRLVRVADDELGARDDIDVYANRGLAGIDGQVSTALGIASATARGADTAVTRAILGDLAFAHDVGGLLLGEGEQRPPLQIVVGNDHGGGIFRGLEVASADPAYFRRVVETPQHIDIAALARAYGWRHVAPNSPEALETALADRRAGIIEVALGPSA